MKEIKKSLKVQNFFCGLILTKLQVKLWIGSDIGV